jgi:transcriptional regulator with XRE-family HTH domain
MSTMKKRQVPNRLRLFRRRRLLALKQVAALLGHRSTQQLSRYEKGKLVPNLKTALKLAAIYGIPVRTMLDGYYEACLGEIRREKHSIEISDQLEQYASSKDIALFDNCSYERKLDADVISGETIGQIRRHAMVLVRRSAERLGHFSNDEEKK